MGPSVSCPASTTTLNIGYDAQGVGPQTAQLPSGWQQRLVRLQTAATNGRVAYCLDPLDLFVSKACAAREKDIDFNRAMLHHGIVALNAALERAQELDHPAEVQRVTAWIRRLALNAGS